MKRYMVTLNASYLIEDAEDEEEAIDFALQEHEHCGEDVEYVTDVRIYT